MKTEKLILNALLIAFNFAWATIAFDSMPVGKTIIIGVVPVLSGVAALNIIMADNIYKFLPVRCKSWK